MGVPLAALSIRPPEQPDMLGEVGKALQLKSMLGAQALQGQKLEESKIDLENARQDQLERQTLRDLFKKNSGDLDKTISDAAASGNVSPKTLINLKTTNLAYQKDLATKDEVTLKNTLATGDLYSGALDVVRKAPVESRPAVAQQQLASLQARGVDVSAVSKQLQTLPDWSDQTLDGVQAAMSGHSKATADELKRREVAAQEMAAQARQTQAGKPQQPTEASLAVGAVKGDETSKAALDLLAKQKIASRPPVDTTSKDLARSDKSYQFNSAQLDKVGKPIEDATTRFGRLQDTVNQATPQADALVAPELLTVMAGGQGSGLRMNEAEIARIVGGRSNFESLKAALNKWQTDPSKALSITPAQRGQIRQLMGQVYGKLQQKQALLDQARQDLLGTDDPGQHRKIVADTRSKMTQVDAGSTTSTTKFTPPAGAPPAPKEDGHKLKVNGQVIAVSKDGQWVAP